MSLSLLLILSLIIGLVLVLRIENGKRGVDGPGT
jgi:hypothetical protein